MRLNSCADTEAKAIKLIKDKAMKISEMIEAMQSSLDEFGDLDVKVERGCGVDFADIDYAYYLSPQGDPISFVAISLKE